MTSALLRRLAKDEKLSVDELHELAELMVTIGLLQDYFQKLE